MVTSDKIKLGVDCGCYDVTFDRL